MYRWNCYVHTMRLFILAELDFPILWCNKCVFTYLHYYLSILRTVSMYCTLGVKVGNMKMNFNTGGTWRQVGQ